MSMNFTYAQHNVIDFNEVEILSSKPILIVIITNSGMFSDFLGGSSYTCETVMIVYSTRFTESFGNRKIFGIPLSRI